MKYTKTAGFFVKERCDEFLPNPDVSHLITSAKSITEVPKNFNKKSDGFSAIQFSKFQTGLG